MITIANSKFDAQGANKKDKVYGLNLSGAEDVVIENCEFATTGYSAILNGLTGKLTVQNCKFNCENNYNPIEGSQAVENDNVIVRDCEFVGAPGNNYINFYRFKDGSIHTIANCKFAPTVDNNAVRVSNRSNAAATFNVSDCEYNYAEGEATEYTNFVLFQDYTAKNGDPEDFTKCVFNLENVKCNGQVIVSKDAAAKGGVYYVYEDGKGLITGGENDPVINIR